jgi:hypothetical protein
VKFLLLAVSTIAVMIALGSAGFFFDSERTKAVAVATTWKNYRIAQLEYQLDSLMKTKRDTVYLLTHNGSTMNLKIMPNVKRAVSQDSLVLYFTPRRKK